MKHLLAAAVLLVLVAPAAATPTAECLMDAEHVTTLASQFRSNLHAKPSETDKRATSVWFHRGYGIGRALHEAMEATLTRCGAAVDQSLPQTVAIAGRELQGLKRRMDAYDRAVGLAP